MVVAVLVFGAGISLVVMLWWLTARFFRLLESRTVDAATMAVIKDMPMGLPDGTVRAILALVVAMVGLPMLVFQGVHKGYGIFQYDLQHIEQGDEFDSTALKLE